MTDTASALSPSTRLVPWGWDCIDCQGDYGANDRCDWCGGTNRIPVYVTDADASRFNEGTAS